MNLIKKILITIFALSIFQYAAAENNFTFSTAPVKLNTIIEGEKLGSPLNYDKLTNFGKVGYKNNLQFMDGGKWNHFGNTKNTYIATDKNNTVAIIKIHYSFKDIATATRYRESLAKRYPRFRQDILSKNRLIIFSDNKQRIDYDTIRNYIDTVILEAESELALDRYRYQNQKLYIEISKDGKSTIETYIDLKLSPQWPASKDLEYKQYLIGIIDQMKKDKAAITEDLLDSKEYMETLLKSKSIYIF